MNKIITIGREFGSGGRELGRRLAELLKFAYYDREVIAEIAKRTSLSEQYVQQIVENRPMPLFPITFGNHLVSVPDLIFNQNMSIYKEQAKIIQEMGEKSDCVIVGRCADSILKDRRPFRIFVYADMMSRMTRCREHAPEWEHLSEKELKQSILNTDKARSKYYEFYTSLTWGDRRNYDLCVNTSGTDIKEIVPAIAEVFKKWDASKAW